MKFRDRNEAGRMLAERLRFYLAHENTIVLALPKGGVPVAYQIAQILGLPMDVLIVRKLGMPGHEELAVGAIASGDITVINPDVVRLLADSEFFLKTVTEREKRELERRERLYRGEKPFPELEGKVVILVDDGLATGATMEAACRAVRMKNPEKIVVTVPVGAPEVCEHFSRLVDEVVCLHTPSDFHAVGIWYHDFSQVSDDEVRHLLMKTEKPSSSVHG